MDLWQTPTYITYMCVIQPDGSVPIRLKGKKAKHALRIYSQWVKEKLNGVFKDNESFDQTRTYVNEELKRIDEVLKSKKLEVYVQ